MLIAELQAISRLKRKNLFNRMNKEALMRASEIKGQ